MNLLALDLSLTSSGWAAKHGASPATWGTFCPTTSGVWRLRDGVAWVDALVNAWRPDVVVIEGYSFGSQNSRAHALGEFGGVIRLHLHQRAQTVVELAPKVRAKLATGNGNASKQLVLVEAVKRLGYPGSSFDEADAQWLLQAALIHYGQPGAVSLPASHLAALRTVEWPDVQLRRAS